MTNLRPTPMDRAPHDPTAPLLGPGQWHCEAPVFRKGEVPLTMLASVWPQ